MKPDERLIVFAYPRTGSTSLARVLALHPELRMLEEPFNPQHVQWAAGNRDYSERLGDVGSLTAVLDEIFAEYTALKTLVYQLPQALNESMLLAPRRKIVFVQRRNLLKAVVSGMIGTQTGLWHAYEATAPVLDHYANLEPISIEETAKRLTYHRLTLSFYVDLLSRLPAGGRLDVFYEDLFLSSPEEQTRQLERIFAFLELEPVSPAAAERFLDPARARLNTVETYTRVPNIRELDEALGNDVTGRLFDVR